MGVLACLSIGHVTLILQDVPLRTRPYAAFFSLIALLGRTLFPGVVHVILSVQQDLRDRDDSIAVVSEILKDSRQGLRCVERCVVKQANGPRLHLTCHPLGDLRRREIFPVQTVTVPYSGKSFYRSILSFSKHIVFRGGMSVNIKHQHPTYQSEKERSKRLQEIRKACTVKISGAKNRSRTA